MGEIGRDISETLYGMSYCDIVLIIRGYRRRNILQYQLQRMQIHAAKFCMGNPEHVKPDDIVHLFFDDYKGQEAPPESALTEQDRRELQAEMDAMNEEYRRRHNT